MPHSPELTGGAGFTYEDSVTAFYLAALLGEESAPGFGERIVTRVALQQANYGEPLDDLIVDGCARDGSLARASFQVKRALTVSAAASNDDFREVVVNAWETLQKPDFREDVDRVGAITGTISPGSRRALDAVCEWARASATLQSFQDHFQPGAASDDHRSVVEAFSEILRDIIPAREAAAGYRLLRHFILISLDVLGSAAVDESTAVNRLRAHLRDPDRAGDLWERLRTLAAEGAAKSAEFSHTSLLTALQGAFLFTGARSYRDDLRIVHEEARHALDSIAVKIDGIEVDRANWREKALRALEKHRFVNIVGLPGAGKSAVLRSITEHHLEQGGTAVVIKSDRISGGSWPAYANELGIKAPKLEDLLAEIAATGLPLLVIDGIDRIDASSRGVVLDLLHTIYGSGGGPWKIVASSRDNGIEPLRTWLPPEILKQGIETVRVGAFDDDESRALAKAMPALRPLLFGDPPVREIARRPFFAAVLARSTVHQTVAARSEIDLVEAWWKHGGYHAAPERTLQRQRALIDLAKAGTAALGRRIRVRDLVLEALPDLKEDGITADAVPGHTVQFTHDIFFEWAFLHVLLDADDWIEEIKAAGEPPALGRAVELLSQAKLAEGAPWKGDLARLERSNLRPQWLRAWLVAPFGLPTFETHVATLNEAIFEGDASRFRKLVVWYQAEKTIPNPRILERGTDVDSSPLEIARWADTFAWPSDVPAWGRFCSWILENVSRSPMVAVPDVVMALQVWQNALSAIPNKISEGIVGAVIAWLQDLEDRIYPEAFSRDYGAWDELSSAIRKELVEDLRTLLLQSASVEVDRVHGYLDQVRGRKRLRHESFESIIRLSGLLAPKQAQDLADLISSELKSDLPSAKERRSSRYYGGVSYHDWHDLSIQPTRTSFFPASPIREPFASLFAHAPEVARALVRDLANHAIAAWRELHQLDHERRGTPIPVVLDFPWGQQTFWGDRQVYLWARGVWAPGPVSSGLMALERWAFAQVDAGRDVYDVIRDVLEGQDSTAVLSIAAALAMAANKVSAATLPLATSQRLWKWDVERHVHDAGSHSNMIGFMKPGDIPHARAVKAENERPVRRMEIRQLAMLFVLGAAEPLRSQAREAILDFPNQLPFELEEHRADSDHAAELRRTAEIWAEYAKRENYTAEAAGDGKVMVTLQNPTAKDPDVEAIRQDHERLSERVVLLNWVNDSMEKRKVSDRLPLADAITRARSFYKEKLFNDYGGGAAELDFEQGAVSGTAAVALLYGSELHAGDLEWCREILLEASKTGPGSRDDLFAGSLVPHHPCLLAAQGLAGAIRRDVSDRESKERLLVLAGHPFEHVSSTAIGSALGLWDVDSRFSFGALNMALRICIGGRKETTSPFGYDHVAARKRIEAAVRDTIKGLTKTSPRSLQKLPPPWAYRPLREPDEFLRWDFLPKLVHQLPVAAIMADAEHREAVLACCDDLVRWFVERLQPVEKDPHDRHSDADVMELQAQFFYQLGLIALRMDPAEAKSRFLDPLFGLEEEEFAGVIRPFADAVVAAGIMDSQEISPAAIQLLVAVVDRLLKDDLWKWARQRDGDIYGFDLPQLVKILLMVAVEAGGSTRFANGDWREIRKVMPIVDPLARVVGDIPHVTSSFLTLCERSREHYPVNQFVDQVLALLDHQQGTPAGWRGTSAPGRIAALVYAFAERFLPLPHQLGRRMLLILDRLVDMGDRRSAALQNSEIFRTIAAS